MDDAFPQRPPSDPPAAMAAAGARARLRQALFGMSEGPPQLGRFIFLRRLGSGGMGTVIAAYDPQLRREVAIKVLRGSTGPEAQQRLVAEARAMAKVKHPNVAVVYEVLELEESVSIVMELIEGETLGRWSREDRSVSERLGALVQAGRGLQAAHAAGLVHCDFKPQNCLVDAGGRVRVLDFGLARAMSAEPTASAPSLDVGDSGTDPPSQRVGGTLRYMPPEQARGEGVEERADQFAFGVTAFELLVGRHPFGADDGAYDPKQSHPEPSFADSRLPAKVRVALTRALRSNPDERYPSFTHLLDALEHDPSASRRTKLWIGGVVGVGALAGALGFWSASRDSVLCDTAEIEQVWVEARRAEVRAAITSVDVPFADDAWDGVSSFVDDYAARLHEAAESVCASQRAADDPEALRLAVLRRACLQERGRDLAAAVDVLADADAGVVRRWSELLGGVAPLSACDDPQRLLATELEPLSEASARARSRELLAEADAIEALFLAGRHERAEPRATALVAAARELGYEPTLARAVLVRANVARRARDAQLAAELTREGFSLAYASGDHRSAAQASVGMVRIEGDFAADAEGAQTWAAIADAAIRRGRLGGRHRYMLLNNLAASAIRSGDPQRAVELYRERSALAQSQPEADPRPGTGQADMAVALSQLGEHAQALAIIEQTIETRRRTLGPHHPDVGYALANAGAITGVAKDIEASVAYTKRALEVLRAALGPDHADLGGLESNLAASLTSLGRFEEALGYARRGVEITQRAFGDEHPRTAEVFFNLGRVLAKLDRVEEARPWLEQALAVFETKYGPEHSRTRATKEKLEGISGP